MNFSRLYIRAQTVLLVATLLATNCMANPASSPALKHAIKPHRFTSTSFRQSMGTGEMLTFRGMPVMQRMDSSYPRNVVPATAPEWLAMERCLPKFTPLFVQRQDAAQQVTGEPKITSQDTGSPLKLNPDDAPFYPAPPAGIDAYRSDIPHGKLQMIEYYSKTVGTQRYMNVYTPPGYTPDKKYPVLYLLHGIGGDETEWERFAKPNLLMDNLLAEKKAVPMILVMPNGRAQKDDRAVGNIYAAAPAFAAFEQDLLQDVIPTIDARYSVLADREHRGFAGLSMGGGQSLDFGLGHLELFAWIGAFSPAPNTFPPAQLVPDPQAARTKLRLLWISCGTQDGLFHISQSLHLYLKQNNVPHIWNVSDRSHDPIEWRNNLYYFLQKVFQPGYHEPKPIPYNLNKKG